jgi:hypothetical protein
MEQTIIDTLGTTITLKYDVSTDTVTVQNPAKNEEFHVVTGKEIENEDNTKSYVIFVGDIPGDEWENTWSDTSARFKVSEFYHENKINK